MMTSLWDWDKNEKVKILQIAHGVYPYVNGGVEIYTYLLSRELIRRGHQVAVASPASAANRGNALMSGVPLYPMPDSERNLFEAGPSQKDKRLAWSSLQKTIHEFQPDVIHIQHLLHMGWQALAKIERLGIPFVMSLHDYWFLCPRIQWLCQGSAPVCARQCLGIRPFQGFRLLGACCWVWRRRRRCVDLLNRIRTPLLAPSRRSRDIFKQSGVTPDRITIHPLGIDVQAFQNSAGRRQERIRFAYFGSVYPAKGVEILVRAFKKLRSKAELHIHGDGSIDALDKLQGLSSNDSLWFHGPYEHRDLPALLSQVDVVVAPSLCEETYHLASQEALAAHKIVIASSIGALKDKIRHGVNGFLFQAGDEDALTRSMSFVAAHYDELCRQLDFDLFQKDIQTDGEEMEHLYHWTRKSWTGLCKKVVKPRYILSHG